MSLPCRVEGLPLLRLSHVEERFLKALSLDGRPIRKTKVIEAIWLGDTPPNLPQCMNAAAHKVRGILATHGYLLHYDREIGSYSVIRDTRQFD